MNNRKQYDLRNFFKFVCIMIADMGNYFTKASPLVKAVALDFGIQWTCWAVAASLKTEKFYDLAGIFKLY
jgi:hypothetical protein